jgi:hypothetical protein
MATQNSNSVNRKMDAARPLAAVNKNFGRKSILKEFEPPKIRGEIPPSPPCSPTPPPADSEQEIVNGGIKGMSSKPSKPTTQETTCCVIL